MDIANGKICKLCGSDNTSLLFVKKGFDIYKCNNCLAGFTDIKPSFDLSTIYDDSYFSGGQEDGYADYVESENVLRAEFNKNLQFLRRNKTNGNRLLEVGCAHGFFLDEAKEYYDCVGIEVSESAVEFAKERGHDVHQGVVTKGLLDKLGDFDVICMFDVIEHLPDPVETLKMLNEKLKPGGIIYIVTGDINTAHAKVFGKHWRLMTPPQHTFFFSKKAFRIIMQKLGYEILVEDRPWKKVPVGLALYQVTSRVGLKMKPSGTLMKISAPVNLFDTIRIIARKK